MRRLFFLSLVAGLFLGLLYVFHFNRTYSVPFRPLGSGNPVPVVYSPPKTLKISSIGVNANVEAVGLDSQKRMGVPSTWGDVAWLKTGYYPGQTGNAVIDGHLDSATAPAVFWNLSKLIPGDKIQVTDANGKTLTFIVTRKAAYPYNNFPINEVFGATDKPMLNLITCDGSWDPYKKIYSDRLVIYSELLGTGNNK